LQVQSEKPGTSARARSNDYYLVTNWRLRGTPDEVIAVLADAREFVR